MDYRLLEENSYLDILKKNISIRKDAKIKLLSEEDVKDIEVENPGILEVPEGKNVEDMGEDHFKSLIKKKGWEEISRALVNLQRWNKNRDKNLSNWADNMQEKLSKWVEDQRKEKGDDNLYEMYSEDDYDEDSPYPENDPINPEAKEDRMKEAIALSRALLEDNKIKYSASKIFDYANKMGSAVEAKERTKCEKWSLKTPFQKQEKKDKMLQCKALASIAGYKASINYMRSMAGKCKDDKCRKKLQNHIKLWLNQIEEEKNYIKKKSIGSKIKSKAGIERTDKYSATPRSKQPKKYYG